MTKIKTIEIEVYECKRCGHEWEPRGKTVPKACPGCNSRVWMNEKEEGK